MIDLTGQPPLRIGTKEITFSVVMRFTFFRCVRVMTVTVPFLWFVYVLFSVLLLDNDISVRYRDLYIEALRNVKSSNLAVADEKPTNVKLQESVGQKNSKYILSLQQNQENELEKRIIKAQENELEKRMEGVTAEDKPNNLGLKENEDQRNMNPNNLGLKENEDQRNMNPNNLGLKENEDQRNMNPNNLGLKENEDQRNMNPNNLGLKENEDQRNMNPNNLGLKENEDQRNMNPNNLGLKENEDQRNMNPNNLGLKENEDQRNMNPNNLGLKENEDQRNMNPNNLGLKENEDQRNMNPNNLGLKENEDQRNMNPNNLRRRENEEDKTKIAIRNGMISMTKDSGGVDVGLANILNDTAKDDVDLYAAISFPPYIERLPSGSKGK